MIFTYSKSSFSLRDCLCRMVGKGETDTHILTVNQKQLLQFGEMGVHITEINHNHSSIDTSNPREMKLHYCNHRQLGSHFMPMQIEQEYSGNSVSVDNNVLP